MTSVDLRTGPAQKPEKHGLLADPFGHYWEIATHKEDVSDEELQKRGREAMAHMQK